MKHSKTAFLTILIIGLLVFLLPAFAAADDANTKYTVTYMLDGEIYGEIEQHAKGEAVKVRETPEVEGCTVSKWSKGNFTMPGSDVVIKAYSTPNRYNLVIHYVFADSGNPAANDRSVTVKYGGEYEFTSPAVKGHTPDNATVSGIMPAENVERTVEYFPTEYNLTVHYIYDGTVEKAAGDHVEKVKYGEEYIVDSPKVEGCRPDQDHVSGVMQAIDTDKTVRYTLNKYNITWRDWDGTELRKDTNVPYGTVPEYKGLTLPERAADAEYTYEFAGWDPKTEKLTRDTVYTAVYDLTANVYSVTYLINGEKIGRSENHSYGETVEPAERVEKEGYRVSKWSVTEPFIMPAGDVFITATAEKLSHALTIHYQFEDGSEAYPDYVTTLEEGERIHKISPTVIGYVPSEASVKYTMAQEDAEYTVTYRQKTHFVVYKVNDIVVHSEPHHFGDEVKVREKYSNKGWDVSDWDVQGTFTMPDDRVEINARAVRSHTGGRADPITKQK